jgi:lysophospholipase L1-like esterase
LGISGNTSDDLLARIEPETRARLHRNEPVLVVIHIGINDSTLEGGAHDRVPINKYMENLAAIVAKIQSISSKLVFVGLSACDESKTAPVSWRDVHYTNDRIKAYENAMRRVAAEQSVPFVPIFDEFMAAVKSGADLLPDGLHPNNAGHELIASLVRPELAKLLAS